MTIKSTYPAWVFGLCVGLSGVAIAEDEAKAPETANTLQFEKRLVAFDANSDGSLDAAELEAFALSVPKEEALQTFMGFVVALGGATDSMIDRVVAFDANKDGKVDKAELPERFRILLEKSDTDKNGSLSTDEIKALASNAGSLELPRELLIELNGRGVTLAAKRVLALDENNDLKVRRDELIQPLRQMFDRADANHDNVLNSAEIQALDAIFDRTGLPREFNDLDGRNFDRGGASNLERVMAFDKDRNGELTRDELFGQRHNLLDRVDANRDGFLDRDELERWERREALATRAQLGRSGDSPSEFEKALKEKEFSDSQKDEVIAIVKAYRDAGRKLPVEARTALVRGIKGVLGDLDYKQFQAEVVESLHRRGGGFNGRYIPTTKIIARLLTFDADKNGQLSTSEIEGMAPRLVQVRRVVEAHHLERREAVTKSSVETITGFDANKDGKIDRAELPERLQALLAQNDADKDGILDGAELKAVENEESFARFVQGTVGGVNLPLIEDGLKNLKVSQETRNKALDCVSNYQAFLRDSSELARVELQTRLENVLGAKELQAFQDSLGRRGPRRGGDQ